MSAKSTAKLDEVVVAVDFGVIRLETKWVGDPAQQAAAWVLAVELLTRVATQSIDLDGGTVREALSSLHALFGVCREALKAGGPVMGVRDGSVGGMTLTVLNKAVRPFLAKWHPRLLAWEATQSESGRRPDESAWAENARCRGELKTLQEGLWRYAKTLAEIAGAVNV